MYNGIANVFTTNIITEAIVNNTSLSVTVNMIQPTSVAAVTVSGNSGETYELVKGTAYAIAASAHAAADKTSKQK